MKKILLYLLFLFPLTSVAQLQGGIKFVGSTVVYTADQDAKNLINAMNEDPSGRLTSTEMYAIVYAISNLKAIDVWNDCAAIYLFIGGTAFKHKFNAKDPRDLDVAYRLSFLGGGFVHSTTGIKPNGSSSYANTFYNTDSIDPTSFSMSYYSRTNISEAGLEMGAYDPANASTRRIAMYYGFVSGLLISNLYNTTNFDGYVAGPIAETTGLALSARISNNHSVYHRGVKLSESNGSSYNSPPSNQEFLFFQFSGLFTSKECAFAHIGYGLTETKVVNMTRVINGYESILNRNIN